MHLLAVLLLMLVQGAESGRRSVRGDPDRALTARDALLTIPDAGGRILPLGDLDRDGSPELAIQRDAGTERSWRIDAVSTRDGHVVRTLWRCEAWPVEPTDWDVGGDIDADGVPDLVLGLGRTLEGENVAGFVIAVSGSTGRELHVTGGARSTDGYGGSVALLGDVNGDGHADYAVGAPESPPLYPIDEPEEELRLLEERGGGPGFVSARSGRDGTELWRVRGQRPGHAFGARLSLLGDLDHDGSRALLVQSDSCSKDGYVLLRGADGTLHRYLPHGSEAVPRQRPGDSFLGRLPELVYETLSPCGDVDGDGVADLAAFEQIAWLHFDRARFLSGRTLQRLFALPSLYCFSEYAICVGVGDLDGDGIDEIALGDADVNIDPEELGFAPKLERLSITEALALMADGGCAFTWESGAAVVYSGKTHAPLVGVFGTPGSFDGMGLQVLGLPDAGGDGHRDVLVAGAESAWIFAGPGK